MDGFRGSEGTPLDLALLVNRSLIKTCMMYVLINLACYTAINNIPVYKVAYIMFYTILVLIKLKKINATALQPQRNVLKFFAIFKSVAHSLEPGETPSYSASHQAPNYVQRS